MVGASVSVVNGIVNVGGRDDGVTEVSAIWSISFITSPRRPCRSHTSV